MGNIHTFEDHVRVRYGVLSAALGAGPATTAEFVDMKNYDLVTFQGLASGVASGVTITLTIWQATTTAGAGSATMTHALATDTFLSGATSETDKLVCQVRGEDLSAGYRYVGAKLSTSASGAAVVGIVINQMRGRYKQASLPA